MLLQSPVLSALFSLLGNHHHWPSPVLCVCACVFAYVCVFVCAPRYEYVLVKDNFKCCSLDAIQLFIEADSLTGLKLIK